MYKISGEIVMESWSFLKIIENMLSLLITITSMLNSSSVSFKYSCSEIQSTSIKRLYFSYPYNLDFEEENGNRLCQSMYTNTTHEIFSKAPPTNNDFSLRSQIFTDFAILNYLLAFIFLIFYLQLTCLSKFLHIVLRVDISVHVFVTALWLCFCAIWTLTVLSITKVTSARYLIDAVYRRDCLLLKNCGEHEAAKYGFLYSSLALAYISLIAWSVNTLVLVRLKRSGNSNEPPEARVAGSSFGRTAGADPISRNDSSTLQTEEAEETEISF